MGEEVRQHERWVRVGDGVGVCACGRVLVVAAVVWASFSVVMAHPRFSWHGQLAHDLPPSAALFVLSFS